MDAQPAHPATTNSGEVVGAGRDAGAVAEMLLGGRSVIGGGPLGAGKSYFLERVADEVTARGATPVHVRGAAALRTVPFGALDAVPDAAAAGLRGEGGAVPRVLIVDDAHELDGDSVSVILRAVYGRRTAALVALTEPRLRGHADGDTVADAFNETWLRGIADRLDLAALHDGEAARLLDIFTERRPFDSVTRAAVIWQADGSRMLLRALADVAASALASGRDPLVAIDDVPPHSRLATALHAHIREFDDESRRALILIDSARGITWSDAARFVPSTTLESLRSVGLLHDDGSARHLLSANRAIARAVERAWGVARSQSVRDEALSRLIADRGRWWSVPLARNLAERWLRTASSPAEVAGVPDELIERVLVDVARDANDRGHATLARAYAEWGQALLRSPALALETGYAELLLGRPWPGDPLIDELDEDGRRRARQASLALQLQEAPAESWIVLGRAADPRGDGAENDAADPWNSGLDAARLAVADLRFGDALAAVTALRAERAATDPIDRVGADLIEATAHAYLGDETATSRSLAAADREFRSAGADIDDIMERLSARCMDLAARTIVGAADDETLRALTLERDDAVRRGGMSLMLAGYASVLADARNGRALEALRELDAAMQRSSFSGGAAAGMIQLDTAYALGAFGFAPEARLVFSTVDEPRYPTRLFTHAHAATAATVAAAEHEWDEARACAALAWEISTASDARSLQARDLHRLVALRHPEFPDAADELYALAEEGSASILRMLADSASRMTEISDLDVVGVLAHLRLGICPHESRHGRAPANPRIARPWADWTPPRSPSTLTPRENEIAALVYQGLSNREIAGTLFLSVRTVESHIYQARAKVGARTRRELGSIVSRVGSRRTDGGVSR